MKTWMHMAILAAVALAGAAGWRALNASPGAALKADVPVMPAAVDGAQEVGLDIAPLRRDMDAPEIAERIQTSMRLTPALGFNGAPSFVIGDALVPGVVDAKSRKRLSPKRGRMTNG